jgi:hypothetical protein
VCRDCNSRNMNNVGAPVWGDDREPGERHVPEHSGEAAIYSPEYLARKEGNARGATHEYWRSMSIL